MQFPFWSMASGSQCFVPVGTLKAASVSFSPKTTTSSLAHGGLRTNFRASAADHCAGGLCFQKSSERTAEGIERSRLANRTIRSRTAKSEPQRADPQQAWIVSRAAISPEAFALSLSLL